MKLPDSVYSDCRTARIVKLTGNVKVGPTMAPEGSGSVKELTGNKQQSEFSFDEEHHTAWYRLQIETSGYLCMDIVPLNKGDDYDFMLFKGGAHFCDSINHGVISPVRACISRNIKDLAGATGLNHSGKKELIKQGVGDAYVKPMLVKKGEEYYLVLDNVYSGGKGHTLHFRFEKPEIIRTVVFSGTVTTDNQTPAKTEVTLTDPAGDILATTFSKADGSYKMKATLNGKEVYKLNFYSDSSFVFSRDVSLKDTLQLSKLATVLPKLKKGKKSSIGSINFFGGSPDYLPSAIPALKNLQRLMKKNRSLKIMLIGHTNGCTNGEFWAIELSRKRAETIREYLLAEKISSDRVLFRGVGCKEMLYPHMKTTWEQEQNRRVEISVVDY